MTFKFPLQKVLDVKEKEKQQAQQELGTSIKNQQETEEKMASLRMIRSSAEKQMARLDRGFKVSELLDQQRYLSSLDVKIERLQKRLQQMNKEVEQKQSILIERSLEEKTWQNWKQELMQRHLQAVQKMEQAQLDEIATTRFLRDQSPAYRLED